jgi:hypothetical protein
VNPNARAAPAGLHDRYGRARACRSAERAARCRYGDLGVVPGDVPCLGVAGVAGHPGQCAGRDAGDGRAGIGGRRLAGGLPRRGGLGGRRAAGTGRLRALPWRAGSACRPDGLGRRGRRHGRRVSARPRWHCRGRRRRVPQQPVFLAGPGGQGVPDHPCSRWRDPYGIPVGRSRLSSSRAPRPGRPSGVAARSASPSPEPVSTRLDCGACEGTEQTRPQQVQTCEGLES